MLGTKSADNKIGTSILTSKSLKKFISSNIFIIKPKQKKINVMFRTTFKNSFVIYLFKIKDFIILI